MDSLFYSLNATLPIFLVIVLGYFLRQKGWVNENFVSVSNKLNFNVILPVYLFCDMAKTDLSQDFQPRLILFCAGATTVIFFAVWLLARLSLKDRAMVGAFVQACFRSNVVILGVALVSGIYGSAGLASQMILGCSPLYTIYAVLVLTVEGERGQGGGNLRRAFKGVVTNPLLIALVSGILLSLLKISLPAFVSKTLSTVGSMATPQALLCIGAGFEGRKAMSKLKPTLAIALVKLLILPGIFLPLAVAFGFRGQALLSILIMLGAPTAVNCYVMAQNMGHDHVLTSSAIAATTLLSSFTITFLIFFTRQLGLL